MARAHYVCVRCIRAGFVCKIKSCCCCTSLICLGATLSACNTYHSTPSHLALRAGFSEETTAVCCRSTPLSDGNGQPPASQLLITETAAASDSGFSGNPGNCRATSFHNAQLCEVSSAPFARSGKSRWPVHLPQCVQACGGAPGTQPPENDLL